MNKLSLVLGNQLFPISTQELDKSVPIFMCEDLGLCTYVKHHKSKIALFFMAMRSYRDLLIDNGFKVNYLDCDTKFEKSYIEKLTEYITEHSISELISYEIEDKDFESQINNLSSKLDIKVTFLESPMFMDTRAEFTEFCKDKKFLLQANYYKKNRKYFDILVEDNKPIGGKWSYDEMNRLKVPKGYEIPSLPLIKEHADHQKISEFIEKNFSDHPGLIHIFTPYTNEQAEEWLEIFFAKRFNDFGPYEDAIVENEHFLLHSILSSSLNMGLITPKRVIEMALNYAETHKIPLNSLEGFVRQIIGWREFIRGVYQNYSEKMIQRNYWNHQRKMKDCWYDGTTGIPPLDNAIKGAHNYGYTHHINRLMILSNIMNMAGIHPDVIYKWFMEMFIDSSDWVMVPNVYGMGTFADGGTFATKPYICGSSYILRMSNFKKDIWCDAVDGLYWKFIESNREFFSSNPRLGLMVRSLDKIDLDRKAKIYNAAEEFIDKTTYV